MTLRDALVQIGFLMVTSGAMLLAWAVLTGQFSRVEPEAIPAEPAEDEEDAALEPIVARASRERAAKARPARRAKPKPAASKPRPRKPRPPA